MKTILTIQGTHCGSCKAIIEDISTEIQGITSCKVDYESGQTTIEYTDEANLEIFKKEIESVGKYKVKINK